MKTFMTPVLVFLFSAMPFACIYAQELPLSQERQHEYDSLQAVFNQRLVEIQAINHRIDSARIEIKKCATAATFILSEARKDPSPTEEKIQAYRAVKDIVVTKSKDLSQFAEKLAEQKCALVAEQRSTEQRAVQLLNESGIGVTYKKAVLEESFFN